MKKWMMRVAMFSIFYAIGPQLLAGPAEPFFSVQSVGETVTLTLNPKLTRAYPSTGMKFTSTSSAFGLPNASSECSSLSASGYCLNTLAPNGSTNLTVSGPSGPFEMSLCLDGRGTSGTTCGKYTISGNRFIYIVRGGGSNDNITICPLNALTGTIITASCTLFTGAGGDRFRDLALNPTGSVAYITTNTPGSYVIACPIDSTTGLFAGSGTSMSTLCHVATDASLGGSFGIKINPQGTFAYILSDDGQNVTRCAVNQAESTLNNCMDLLTSSHTSYRLVLNPEGTFLYIGNTDINEITRCRVHINDGSLTNCQNAILSEVDRALIKDPLGVALNTEGTLFYTANSLDNNIIMCTVNKITGLLSSCQKTGPTLANPQGVVINHGSVLAYLSSDVSGTVFTCGMDPITGEIQTDCTDSTLSVLGNITLR